VKVQQLGCAARPFHSPVNILERTLYQVVFILFECLAAMRRVSECSVHSALFVKVQLQSLRIKIVDETNYFANCAWNSFGIPAALHRPGQVHSRCEQSGEPLTLEIGLEGPPPCSWLFHCLVPAAKWWDDIVFT